MDTSNSERTTPEERIRSMIAWHSGSNLGEPPADDAPAEEQIEYRLLHIRHNLPQRNRRAHGSFDEDTRLLRYLLGMFATTIYCLPDFLANSLRIGENERSTIANDVRARLLELGDEAVHAARRICLAGKRLPGPDGRKWCESLCFSIRWVSGLVEKAPPRPRDAIVTLDPNKFHSHASEMSRRHVELTAMLPDPFPTPNPVPTPTIAPVSTENLITLALMKFVKDEANPTAAQVAKEAGCAESTFHKYRRKDERVKRLWDRMKATAEIRRGTRTKSSDVDGIHVDSDDME